MTFVYHIVRSFSSSQLAQLVEDYTATAEVMAQVPFRPEFVKSSFVTGISIIPTAKIRSTLR